MLRIVGERRENAGFGVDAGEQGRGTRYGNIDY